MNKRIHKCWSTSAEVGGLSSTEMFMKVYVPRRESMEVRRTNMPVGSNVDGS